MECTFSLSTVKQKNQTQSISGMVCMQIYKCILKCNILYFVFTFIHFAEAIIQSDLQIIILHYIILYIVLYCIN